MIAVWIVGVVFLVTGLLLCVPTCMRLFKCKGHSTGEIIGVDDLSDHYIRAIYEYIVSGNKYTNKTHWTAYGIFRVGAECHVVYEENNPNCSYMKWSGENVRCFLGTIFALVGLGVLLLGLFLSSAL